MTPEQVRAFRAVQDAALKEVEDPFAAEQPSCFVGGLSVLTSWKSDSFGEHAGWAVRGFFEQERATGPLTVRSVAWDRATDYARFSDPLEALRLGASEVPTLVRRVGVAPASAFTELRGALSSIALRFGQLRNAWGTDGATGGISHKAGFNSLELKLWGGYPGEFEPLLHWQNAFRETVERHLGGTP